MYFQNKIVISIGGSLICHQKNISLDFLSSLNKFIRQELKKNSDIQFFLVVGGGYVAKHYSQAGRQVVGHQLTYDDMDWLGIHATRLNAHLVKTIFRDIAHPHVLKHYEIIRKVEEKVIVATGWKPGITTDFCATMICEDYKINTIINLTRVDTVYSKDPSKHLNIKPIKRIAWKEFRQLVGDELIPETHAPFDPVATKRAQELGLKVVVLNGNNFTNIKNCLQGKRFTGTIISD